MNRALSTIERIDLLRRLAVEWEATIIAAGETGMYRGQPISADWVRRERRMLAEHRAELTALANQ